MGYRRDINIVVLSGRVGSVDLRYTATSTARLVISLATSYGEKDFRSGREELVEKTDWHHVVKWGKTAEALHPVIKVGQQLTIEGRLRTYKITTQAGKEQTRKEVLAYNIIVPNRNEPLEPPADAPPDDDLADDPVDGPER